jgi:hypothetical protein
LPGATVTIFTPVPLRPCAGITSNAPPEVDTCARWGTCGGSASAKAASRASIASAIESLCASSQGPRTFTAVLVPAEVRLLDLLALEEVLGRVGQDDLARLKNVASVCDLEGHTRVLLHEKDRGP